MTRALCFGLSLCGLSLAGCGLEELQLGPDGVLLVAPADADVTTERMLEQTSAYLTEITGGEPLVARLGSGRFDELVRRASDRGAGLVIAFEADRLASDRVDPDRVAGLAEGGFVLQTEDAGDTNNRLGDEGATFVLTAGGSKLAQQYASYEVLRRLGVRFFHPEQEYVPRHELADLRELAKRPTAISGTATDDGDHEPDFGWRSWNFHSSHPLEHLESFSDAAYPIDEARNVNEWQVKNFGNRFRGAGRGVATGDSRAIRVAELEEMRSELGFPRGTGITLHNQQQGASAEIDRESSTPVQQQIEDIVTERLTATPDARWFGIHFGETEFSTTDADETVQWINWAGRKALELAPDVEVEINNHITGSQPMEGYGDLGCPNTTSPDGTADYYDLSFHTDPRLGVRVHTVMFYPLEGPARVYNQQSFAHKLCLMEQASAEGRRVGWFPEGSWWLSFDNPIPVYLPLHIWTRWRDVDLLRPLLASRGNGTLKDHRMFNSGHEWGYWQQDYAVGMLGWNADVTPEQIWDELLDPLCPPSAWRDGCAVKDEVASIMTAVVDHQRELFLEAPDWQGNPGGLYTYFAGEDQADIIASDSGLEFRPVRVSFAQVMQWDRAALDHFRATDLAAINEAAVLNAGWRDRFNKVREFVAEDGLPWFEEIVDGVEINEMRARQTAALYTAVLAVREGELVGDPEPTALGEAQYGAAQMVLNQAEIIIRRREAAYRYAPEQVYGGGLTPETGVPNGTTYPYRVHTKTHLLTYWNNRDAEVRAILDGDALDPQNVQLVEAMDEPGAAVTLTWPEDAVATGSVTIGESIVVDPSITEVDLGPDEGYWPVAGSVVANNPFVDVRGGIVRSSVRAMTPKSGLELIVPADEMAQGVLAGVFPAIQWAWVSEPDALVFATDEDDDGSVDHQRVVYAAATLDGDAFETAEVAFTIPVSTSGGDEVEVQLSQVVLSGELAGGVIGDPIHLLGQISVDDLVAALVILAGFDEAGSLLLLAGLLDFDADNPPDTVPVEALLDVQPRER